MDNWHIIKRTPGFQPQHKPGMCAHTYVHTDDDPLQSLRKERKNEVFKGEKKFQIKKIIAFTNLKPLNGYTITKMAL